MVHQMILEVTVDIFGFVIFGYSRTDGLPI